MTNEHLAALLELGGAKLEDGWSVLGPERTMTLHLAYEGASLNVSKIQRVTVKGELLYAASVRGETTVICLADAYAGSIDGQSQQARYAAGFRS
jgi:hypothetical protein